MTKFRPCIDLHDGQVKQIVGSTLGGTLTTNFVATQSSKDYAMLYKENELFGAHVIMLGPNNTQACLEAIQTFPMQVGGGISIDNCDYWIKNGASHVIVTSCLFINDEFQINRLKELSDTIGKEKIVVDLSCKCIQNDYFVCINKWKTVTSLKLSKESIHTIEQYCGELLVHATDIEGMQNGTDQKLVQLLGEWCTIPCTYAGGATSIADLDLVHTLTNGKIDVTIGSALDIFGGSLSFKDCVAWNQLH